MPRELTVALPNGDWDCTTEFVRLTVILELIVGVTRGLMVTELDVEAEGKDVLDRLGIADALPTGD